MAVLNLKSVEAAKPDPTKRRAVPDGALPGLYFVVQPSGGKLWVVRYKADIKPKQLTPGRYPRVPLTEAREAARTALRSVAEGRDPAGEKQAAKAKPSATETTRFGAVVADYSERYAKPRNRSWRETESFLTRTLDATDRWQDRDIRTIGRKDVLNALDAVVGRGVTIHANRLFAALRRFFAWTVERGILEASPMAGLKPPSPEPGRRKRCATALAAYGASNEEIAAALAIEPAELVELLGADIDVGRIVLRPNIRHEIMRAGLGQGRTFFRGGAQDSVALARGAGSKPLTMRPFDVLRIPEGDREPALRQAAQRQLVAFDLLEVSRRLPAHDAAAEGIQNSRGGLALPVRSSPPHSSIHADQWPA